MADRPRYSRSELKQWFDRIALPECERLYDISEHSDYAQACYLARLVKHTLIRIPFENLTQHYSWHRTINVRPQHLFNKIVREPSHRGGYCMEANTLFHTVLLSLGFKVFMAGARVYNKETKKYGGFSHCNNIVIIGFNRWMVDVGFGANGPTVPLCLEHDVPVPHLGKAEIRLVHEGIRQHIDDRQKVWIYQHRFDRDLNFCWTPMYCFVDVEFLPEDISGMNLSPWKSPHSWFTQKVVLTRFVTKNEPDETAWEKATAEERIDGGTINGVVILFQDTLKWRRDGETSRQIKLKSEEERIDAIRDYFGIELDEEDREAIRGTVAEIKSDFRPFD